VLTISDSANAYYGKTYTHTVASTFNEQVTLNIEKKFQASFTFKTAANVAIAGIKVTMTASTMTAQTRITDASGIALFVAIAEEFKATTVVTITISDPAGVYNESNFSPATITLSGYSLTQLYTLVPVGLLDVFVQDITTSAAAV
jgi:hypothetical protein